MKPHVLLGLGTLLPLLCVPVSPLLAGEPAAVLKQYIIEQAQSGAKPVVPVRTGPGKAVSAAILAADEAGLKVKAEGAELNLSWKLIGDAGLYEMVGPLMSDAPVATHAAYLEWGIQLGRAKDPAFQKLLERLAEKDGAAARKIEAALNGPAPEGPAPGSTAATNGRAAAREPRASDPDKVEPGDHPSLPKEISPFDPPGVSGKVSDDGPVFAEWTRSGDPGDIVVVTGHGLTKLADKQACQDAEFTVFGQAGIHSGGVLRAELVRGHEQGAAIRLPANLPPDAMYVLWVRNANGLSRPAVINRTDAWWLGPDKATRGETVSVFGRNLTRNAADSGGKDVAATPTTTAKTGIPGVPATTTRTANGKTPAAVPLSWVYVRATAGGSWASVVGANPYRVDFTVPANLPNGEYEVWSHNGRGGAYGWSGPLKLTVADGPGWTQAVVNVKEMGAVGNGTTDDTAAIQKALQAAQGRRGTLAFPAGTYLISKGLEPGSNVRWLGAGMDKTILKCSKSFPPGEPILGGGAKNLEIKDLALEANAEPKRANSGINIRGATDIHFVNVRVMNHQAAGFDIQGDRWVFFQGCDIIGGDPSFMGGASQVFLDGCTFEGMYDTNSLVASWAGTCISMTNCTGKDYDNTTTTGWGSGRFFVCMSHWGANRYQYFGGNASVDLCVRDRGDQNSGEQFLWELGTSWQGAPTGGTPTTVGFSGDLKKVRVGDEAAIVKGKGLGQNRRITAVANGTVTVQPAWNVPPDASSLIVTGGFADRIVFYKNSIDGKPRGMKGTASCAINAYGCTFNMVGDSNTCHETNGSFSNFGRIGGSLTSETGSFVMPVYFSLYTNNRVETCSGGTINFLDSGGDAVLVLGAISRKNTFINVQSPVATYGKRGNSNAGLLNVSDQNATGKGPLPPSVE